MLTTDEAAAFRNSVSRVADLAQRGLGQARDATAAIEFVAQLHRSVDQVSAEAFRSGPRPDCKAGCAHCCSVRVEVTDPEAFRIARWLRAGSPLALGAVIERLRQRAAEGDAPAGGRRPPCTFLADGLCSIYEVRPATCRKGHSLSVQQCASFAPTLPQNLKLIVDAEALMAGTAEAYRQSGLGSAPHELLRAVLTALEDETAEARWFAGESVL